MNYQKEEISVNNDDSKQWLKEINEKMNEVADKIDRDNFRENKANYVPVPDSFIQRLSELPEDWSYRIKSWINWVLLYPLHNRLCFVRNHNEWKHYMEHLNKMAGLLDGTIDELKWEDK